MTLSQDQSNHLYEKYLQLGGTLNEVDWAAARNDGLTDGPPDYNPAPDEVLVPDTGLSGEPPPGEPGPIGESIDGVLPPFVGFPEDPYEHQSGA